MLEEYRDRILMFDKRTYRLVITRELQKPFRGVFHANFESRGVADALFPLRLPVYPFNDQLRTALWYHSLSLEYDCTSPPPPLECEPLNEIPVSLEHDHFLLGLSWWNLSGNP